MAEWSIALPRQVESLSAHWSAAAFRDEVQDWCAAALGAEFGRITALTQTKLRAWSTVWRVETGDAAFYLKQNCPLQSFEGAVVAELSGLSPRRVVPVVAIDRTRGFLLTPDQGDVFGDTAGDDVVAWCRLATQGALLQREVAPATDLLAAAGLTRLSAVDAVAYVEARLAAYAALPVGTPGRISPEDAVRLRAHLPVVRRWSEAVSALGLPMTLNHNDLHENNVFEVDGELRFFDFGDALLTEPLQVLRVPLEMLRHRLACAADDPRLGRVAEAALEVWSDLVPLAELRAALPAALQLGRLGRCESWVRVLASVTPTERAEYGGHAATWLLSLLEESPLTGPS